MDLNVNNALMVAATIAASFRLSAPVLVLMLTTWVHSIAWALGAFSDGYSYFMFAGLADAVVVAFIAWRGARGTRDVAIQQICIAFIMAQLVGVILFHYYYSSVYYNAICSVLYVATIITIISRDKTRRGRCNKDHRLRVVSGPAASGSVEVAQKNESV